MFYILYIKMYIYMAMSSLALAFMFYKAYGSDNENRLDQKLDNYYSRKEEIYQEIIDHKEAIEKLYEEIDNVDENIVNLLTKKILTFHKEHIKFNNKAVRNIRTLIDHYSNGNEGIEDKVYENIDPYVDVEQVKDCDPDASTSSDDEENSSSEESEVEPNDDEKDGTNNDSTDEEDEEEDEDEDEEDEVKRMC
jgi:hypothetical protein